MYYMGKFDRPLKGEILRDSRTAERRTLRLSANASPSETWSKVLIHDLSENGLMFETAADIELDEIVFVDLPRLGSIEARIVWQDDTSFGCEFLVPISRTAVNAALLRSPRKLPHSDVETTVEELSVGIKPSLEDMTNWKAEFERTKGINGYRLIGFRQTATGVTIAMVTKIN
jgi:hypothetical protein